jgi:hypothetical protein
MESAGAEPARVRLLSKAHCGMINNFNKYSQRFD